MKQARNQDSKRLKTFLVITFLFFFAVSVTFEDILLTPIPALKKGTVEQLLNLNGVLQVRCSMQHCNAWCH